MSEIPTFQDSNIQLLIFDCDGTLVDSEYLYNAITAELLNEIGLSEYTPELCLELFSGMAWSAIRTELEERHKQPMPEDIIRRYITIANRRMHDDFSAVPDANQVVEALGALYKTCVASNGERGNVMKSLEVTGLINHFEDSRIFTKMQVANPKPAPDLFLFACENMQTLPANTLIIEDSIAGVTAAKAAGIAVLGFVGTAHNPQKQAELLKNAGADHIIDRLIHIDNYLKP